MEDITAWVDFTRVAEAADSAGLEVLGFATQAALLLGAGHRIASGRRMHAGDDQAAGGARRRGAPPADAR